MVFSLIFFNLSPILAYLPNDPKFSEQKSLNDIKITQAWDMTRGSEDVVIAVLDSGVDIDHPDLKNNIWVNKGEIFNDGLDNDKNGYIDDVNGYDFVDNSNNPNPVFSSNYTEIGINHGTIISGLIAAQGDNGQGIIGVCPKCKIMPLKVLDNQGVGNTGAVIEAINYAIDKRVDVINMSFVGSNYSASLAEAVKKAYQAGIVLVVASGNDSLTEGDDLFITPSYPICNDGDDNYVIGVAALDNKGQRAIFSNYGADFIDISAPGSSLYSTLVYSPENKSNEYYGGYWSGTSVATALVSGVAGLIKSLNPLFSPKQVRESIAEGAENIDFLNPSYKGKLGAGKLNAYNAVKDAYLRMASFSSSEYIVTGAGNGGGPHVRAFNSNGFPGSFNFFAYDKNFRGGVNVAVGDIDGDGKAEIITGGDNYRRRQWRRPSYKSV
ncbi:MAG: Peptidase S8 and S53, subtilisin, kexin, sedolisin [Parcubacteria group bacterium Athens1014_10]|nr:MAG: Peptidase S8 and S53, subtilisin, kexin, sedolisin [Parcubacteria group bacterium Athens1014_10]